LTVACLSGGCQAAAIAGLAGGLVNGGGTALQGGRAPDVVLASGLGAASSLETAGAGSIVNGENAKVVVAGISNAATTLQQGGTTLQAVAAGGAAALVQKATHDLAQSAAAGSLAAKAAGQLAIQGVRKTATFEAKAVTKPSNTAAPPPPKEFTCGPGEAVSCGK
jgi:hypothetical protein